MKPPSTPFRLRPTRGHPTAAALAPFAVLLVSASALAAPQATTDPAAATSSGAWEFVVSPYMLHWKNEPDHRRVGLIGLERHDPGRESFWGLSLFPNSFGQPSAYAYYGREWNGLAGHEALFAKVSAGIIYGYKGEYEDKLPFNYRGFAPAVIPAIGWRLTPQDSVQAAVLGNAGLMFMYSRRF